MQYKHHPVNDIEVKVMDLEFTVWLEFFEDLYAYMNFVCTCYILVQIFIHCIYRHYPP